MKNSMKIFIRELEGHGIVDALKVSVNMSPPPDTIPAELAKELNRTIATDAINRLAATNDRVAERMAEAAFDCLFDELFKVIPLDPDPKFVPTPEQIALHTKAIRRAEDMKRALDGILGDLLKAIFN